MVLVLLGDDGDRKEVIYIDQLETSKQYKGNTNSCLNLGINLL